MRAIFPNKFVAFLPITVLLLFAYNNCGPFQPSGSFASFLSLGGKFIGPDRLIMASKDPEFMRAGEKLTFSISRSLFPESIQNVVWDHTLDGTNFCDQLNGEDKTTITCAQGGELNLLLIVEYESGVDQTYSASISIGEKGEAPPTTEEPAPEEEQPETSAPNGQQLYLVNCQGCHGPAPGEKSGSSAQAIQGAIQSVPTMASLSGLSTEELEAIADYIK